jgi:hypothetical protein
MKGRGIPMVDNIKKDYNMKQILLLVLIFLSLSSYSQNRVLKGGLISFISAKDLNFKLICNLDGGLVLAEPSKKWSIITAMARFNIECNKTDTMLTFHLYDRIFNYKINSADSLLKIEIDASHSNSERHIDSNEEFQVIISDVSLPIAFTDYYFINNTGIWVQTRVRDSISRTYYPIESTDLKLIKDNIGVIVDSIAPTDYHNNNVDDGQEIEISILYKGKLFEYTFQMYYNDLINNLLVSINSIVKESDKINYEWTKKYMKN